MCMELETVSTASIPSVLRNSEATVYMVDFTRKLKSSQYASQICNRQLFWRPASEHRHMIYTFSRLKWTPSVTRHWCVSWKGWKEWCHLSLAWWYHKKHFFAFPGGNHGLNY